MPDLSQRELIGILKIYSVCRFVLKAVFIKRFREPHHTTTNFVFTKRVVI